MQCPTCKQELDAGVRFCPHDGTPVTETTASLPTRADAERTAANLGSISKELELPLVIGGRYRLTDLRGGGGMAKVYRAVDVTLEREVAVKLINPELLNETEFEARFQREARIASQLSDPHIIVVHDFGIDPAHGPFLVMEYLHGQSLRERLQSEGPLPLQAGLQMSAQLLLALIHAHDKNIVHRDIKPDNIFLLNQSGVRLHVRVLDFGIARIYRRGEGGNAETLTNPGAVLGTPRYMSPEQLAGQSVEAASDLYSAALVIHEALTGQLPYVSGKKLRELCPEASPALQELLDHCLKPNPAERPASAIEVYLRLQELGKASGILLLPPSALDELTASRKAPEPTVAYAPAASPGGRRWRVVARLALLLLRELGRASGILLAPPSALRKLAASRRAPEPTVAYPTPAPRGRQRRRVLFGFALLLLFSAIAAGCWWLCRSKPADLQHESLLGIHIGDAQQEVVERLKLTKGGSMNPWEGGRPPAYLGYTLKATDLDLPADVLGRLDVQRTEDDRVCVVFFEDKVRAVVVRRARAGTGRGLKVQDRKGRVADVYTEDFSQDISIEVNDSGRSSRKIEIRRYDTLGIGFEMHETQVTAITLYPPVPTP